MRHVLLFRILGVVTHGSTTLISPTFQMGQWTFVMPLLLIQDYIPRCFHHFTLNPTSYFAYSNSKLYPIQFPSYISFQVCTSMRLFTRCKLSRLMVIKWSIPSMSPMHTTWIFNGVLRRTMPSESSSIKDPTTVRREMLGSL